MVTISSSDDDESMARTAEWVAAVRMENGGFQQECNIELGLTRSKNRADGETEEVCHRLSLLQIPTTQSVRSSLPSSNSFSSPSVTYPGPSCPKSAETSLLGVCTSKKHHGSEVPDSLRPNLLCANTSEMYKRTTFINHDYFPQRTNICEQNINTTNPSRISSFDSPLPSIQAFRPLNLSTNEKRQVSANEMPGQFCIVKPHQNTTVQNCEVRNPFYTIKHENHRIVTPLSDEQNSSFYSSTPVKSNRFCEQNPEIPEPEKQQDSPENRPLCSSTPEHYLNTSRLGIEDHKPSCNVTLGQKQTTISQEHGCFSKSDCIEVQSSLNLTGSPSILTQSSILENPLNSKQVTNPRTPHTLTLDSSVQSKDFGSGNQRELYFGSLKPLDSTGQLLASDVEENTSAKDCSLTLSNEGFISGIEPFSDGNPESFQESVPKSNLSFEKTGLNVLQWPDSSDDENNLLSSMSDNDT